MRLIAALVAAAYGGSIIAAELPKDYRPSPQDFRVVDGVLYNIKLSTNWIRIPSETFGGSIYTHVSVFTKVETVIPEGVVFTFVSVRDVWGGGVAGGTAPRVVRTERNYGPKILVKNHPAKTALTTGQNVEPMMLMRVGTFEYGGEVIAMYDYGLPNRGTATSAAKGTNLVPKSTNILSR